MVVPRPSRRRFLGPGGPSADALREAASVAGLHASSARNICAPPVSSIQVTTRRWRRWLARSRREESATAASIRSRNAVLNRPEDNRAPTPPQPQQAHRNPTPKHPYPPHPHDPKPPPDNPPTTNTPPTPHPQPNAFAPPPATPFLWTEEESAGVSGPEAREGGGLRSRPRGLAPDRPRVHGIEVGSDGPGRRNRPSTMSGAGPGVSRHVRGAGSAL